MVSDVIFILVTSVFGAGIGATLLWERLHWWSLPVGVVFIWVYLVGFVLALYSDLAFFIILAVLSIAGGYVAGRVYRRNHGAH